MPAATTVLLELAARHLESPDGAADASSRKLASTCNLSRSATIEALDILTAKNLITARQGNTTTATKVRVNVFDTVPIDQKTKKDLVRNSDHPPASGWYAKRTSLDQTSDHPGLNFGPPPTENKELPPTPGPVDVSSTTEIFDRMVKANPKRTDANTLATMRSWLHGYMVKFGRDPHAHPPDDHLVAQFLSIADLGYLQRLLQDLMAERKAPEVNYAWFITVAMQRIHGMTAQAQKARRAALHIARAGRPPEPEQQDLLAQVQAIAQAKTFR